MMNEKGKKQQILFEPALRRNVVTSELEEAPNGFLLWTDSGLGDLIRNIEGIIFVQENFNSLPTYYYIIADPRYDIEFVKRELEANIILKLGEI